MRPHWFFEEDDKYSIKTKDKLLKLYYNTVGNNSCLMLGLSPNKRGEFDDVDTQILTALGCDLKLYFGYNLLKDGKVSSVSSEHSKETKAENVLNEEMESFWRPAKGDKRPEIVFDLPEKEYFDKIVIGENIADGQHIEAFDIYGMDAQKKKWKKNPKTLLSRLLRRIWQRVFMIPCIHVSLPNPTDICISDMLRQFL